MISGNNSLLCSAAAADDVKLIVCVALTIKGTFPTQKPPKNSGGEAKKLDPPPQPQLSTPLAPHPPLLFNRAELTTTLNMTVLSSDHIYRITWSDKIYLTLLQDERATLRLAQVAEEKEEETVMVEKKAMVVVVDEEEGNRYADFSVFPPSN